MKEHLKEIDHVLNQLTTAGAKIALHKGEGNTEGICGLESIRPDTSCPAKATPRSQVEVT